MARIDAFAVFWLTGVAAMGVASLAFGIREFKSGYARWGLSGEKIARSDEPFYYWMIVGGRFFGVIVAGFMFWFGLGFMGNLQ